MTLTEFFREGFFMGTPFISYDLFPVCRHPTMLA